MATLALHRICTGESFGRRKRGTAAREPQPGLRWYASWPRGYSGALVTDAMFTINRSQHA